MLYHLECRNQYGQLLKWHLTGPLPTTRAQYRGDKSEPALQQNVMSDVTEVCVGTTWKEAFNSTHQSLEGFVGPLKLGVFQEDNGKTTFQAARRECENHRTMEKPCRMEER